MLFGCGRSRLLHVHCQRHIAVTLAGTDDEVRKGGNIFNGLLELLNGGNIVNGIFEILSTVANGIFETLNGGIANEIRAKRICHPMPTGLHPRLPPSALGAFAHRWSSTRLRNGFFLVKHDFGFAGARIP
jgi:hypothetical protein